LKVRYSRPGTSEKGGLCDRVEAGNESLRGAVFLPLLEDAIEALKKYHIQQAQAQS
jgi:hypothetical protein